jgi:hypothetical protein
MDGDLRGKALALALAKDNSNDSPHPFTFLFHQYFSYPTERKSKNKKKWCILYYSGVYLFTGWHFASSISYQPHFPFPIVRPSMGPLAIPPLPFPPQ